MTGVTFGGPGGISYLSDSLAGGSGQLTPAVAVADNEAKVFQFNSTANLSPQPALVVTTNVFITGLATADTIDLALRFTQRFAQIGPLGAPGDYNQNGTSTPPTTRSGAITSGRPPARWRTTRWAGRSAAASTICALGGRKCGIAVRRHRESSNGTWLLSGSLFSPPSRRSRAACSSTSSWVSGSCCEGTGNTVDSSFTFGDRSWRPRSGGSRRPGNWCWMKSRSFAGGWTSTTGTSVYLDGFPRNSAGGVFSETTSTR